MYIIEAVLMLKFDDNTNDDKAKVTDMKAISKSRLLNLGLIVTATSRN